MTLIGDKTSAGVKDYLGTDIISRNSKFTHDRLREIDYTSIQLSKWTSDDHKNELVKQLIMNYLRKYKELDAQIKRQKFNITIGDELLKFQKI
jgi:DNA-directed RNA polymerase subunit beta